jgi:hypothetical protein
MSDAVPSATSSLSHAQRWCEGARGVGVGAGVGSGPGAGVGSGVAPLPPTAGEFDASPPLVTGDAGVGVDEELEQPPTNRPAASTKHETLICNCLDMGTLAEQ